MDALIEQLEDLLAGAAGGGPDELAVDADRHRFANGGSGEQLSSDVAVGDRSDYLSLGVVRKQDSEHVGVETPKGFLDRLGLGVDEEGAFQHVSSSKSGR